MPGLHAILSASASKRWLSCPPSARLEEKLRERFGDGETEFAREGTKAHALSELKLRKETGEINEFNFKARREALGDIPPEMERATDFYVDIVMQKFYEARRASSDAQLLIEQQLDYSDIAPGGFGTGDAIIVSDLRLCVCDLKYGKGVVVEAEGNTQMRLYGYAAMKRYGDLYGFREVCNTIIQPRLGRVTEKTLSTGDLENWGITEVAPTARLAWEGRGEFKSGDHCRFCAARAICWHRMSEIMRCFTETGLAPVIPDDQIPGILAISDTAESWIKDIREYARTQAIKGQQWNGWKLVYGKRGTRRFRDPAEAERMLLRAGYEKDQIEETRLRSVADLEKTLGTEAFRALVGPMVQQDSGAPELAPENDRRAAYSQIETDFADMEDLSNG